MTEKTLIVENKNGIHARPSAKIVECILEYSSPNDVKFYTSTGEADAKSIMSLLMLRAVFGTEIRAVAKGPDETEILDSLEAIFKDKFGFEE